MRKFAFSVVGVVATALLLVLAMPPSRAPWLAWGAFVPLLLSVRGRRFAMVSAFAACLLAGVLAESGLVYPRLVEAGDPRWTYLGYGDFGIVAAIVATVWSVQRETTARTALVVAAVAVLGEALTLVYLPAHLALTQSREPAVVGLAPWTGIWGASYVVWAVNLLLATWIERREFRRAAVGAAALAVTLVAVRLADGGPEPGGVRIAAMQTDRGELGALANRNAKAGAAGATLVVWPELSGMASARRGDASALIALARTPGQPPFVTSFQSADAPLPKNVAAVFSAAGESRRYAKRRPFGSEVLIHAPGDEAVAVDAALVESLAAAPTPAPSASSRRRSVHAALAICFDSCFPWIVREGASLDGVEVLLVPTHDPDTPSGSIQTVHAAFMPFRAAELGLPIVRADVTARSQIVDADGRVLAEAGIGTDECIAADIVPGRRWTLARAAGDWFVVACGVAVAAAIVHRRRRKPAAAAGRVHE
ncbi:MAG: hypothetical protein K8T90_11355 [Planctomycetes bacterium]|nr:hypothetical protein [Planctomycetota bacterium]